MENLYDPNAPASAEDGIFGLPLTENQSKVVLIPVPWEATTSYGGGTAYGPHAIIQASPQIDLFDLEVVDPWKAGIFCKEISDQVLSWNDEAIANKKNDISKVNALSLKLNSWLQNQTSAVILAGKIPGIIGGDHSSPFGAYCAAAEHFGNFGILHIDAHSDTRNSYMGFTDSHASIMHNAVTKIADLKQLTQVGIRDFCDEEYDFISTHKRVTVFFDHDLTEAKAKGESFHSIVRKIVSTLPQQVWISVDIDGLDPRFCPNTGTPVPGGLDYSEAILLFTEVAKSGRKIIGFDVVEVAPKMTNGQPIPVQQASDEWDANVGMRVIYKLCALSLASQGFAQFRKRNYNQNSKKEKTTMGRGRKNKTQKMKNRKNQAKKKARAKKKSAK